MTYQELYEKWHIRFKEGDAPSELVLDLEQLSMNNLVIFKKDLICDKGKMTFVSGMDTYKMKIKKVVK